MNGFYLEPVGSHNGIPLPDFRGYTCGRQRTNDIMMNSVTVSREHCTFTVSQNHFQVYDLQSANGTYINGQRVQPKVFHTVRIGNVLGISCHKTEDNEFEENETRFVYRLRRLPVDYSKQNDHGNLKEEVGEKRKSNGVSPVPCKVPRLENVEDDDCIMIEDDPIPNVQPELRLPIVHPSTSAAQVGQENSLIKYELDIPEEEEEEVEENSVINNRPDPQNSAQTSNPSTNPIVNGSTSHNEQLSLASRSSSLLNDEANSNDIFSDSPVSSPKIAAKNIDESVVVKKELKVEKDTDEPVDVNQTDNDDVVIFPASQLFDDEEAANDDNNATADAAPVSSIIKEECDLGTDNIDCYNGSSTEEVEESEYPVIVLSDDDDEYDSTRDPWLMKLSGSQLESRSSSEIESLKIKEEPIDQNDDKEDEIVNGLLDSLEKEEFLIETEDTEMSDGVIASEDMITDEIEDVKEPVKLTEAVAAVAIPESVKEKDVKKGKKDKKNKIPEDRRKESHSKPKDKSKSRKSERDSSSKDLSKQLIDAYEFRTSFEEPKLAPYQSTKKVDETKKIKKIIIRSNVEFTTPIVKSIIADEMSRPSKESKVDKNEKPVEKDEKEEPKNKGAIKKHKVVQEESKDQVRVEEKIKRAEKDKPKNKKKNKYQKKENKKKEEKAAHIPFEEALLESDKNIIDDKKKIKKRKTSQESSEERKSDKPVASTSAAAETLSKEPVKAETETKILVIDGRRVSISKKVEKKIKTIEPPIFTRGGRHGVSATLSASDVALNTPKASDEAGSSPPTGTDNQEEDYNSDLFSKPTKLANSSKSDNPIEKQKDRLRKSLREKEIRDNAGSIHKAINKRHNKELLQDRKEKLKQLTEKPKGNGDNTATKRVSKAVAKVSRNRGMFLVPEGVNLDDSKDDDAAKKEPVKINNVSVFDLHAEGIKNNQVNANSTAVDDLSDVISTNSCPGYPEPPPQEDKDTDSDSSHDMNAIADPGFSNDIDMEDTLKVYIDTPTTSNGRSASSSPNDYSPPKINYSRQIRKVSPEPCIPQINQVFSRPSAASRPSNSSFHQSSRIIRGILKKTPERGEANYVPNGISSNNLPQIGKPKKRIRFATTPPVVHLIDILPGNKLIRKCIQKDAAMPKTVVVQNTLPGDPSMYLPNLSTITTPKALPAPPSASAPVHQNQNASTLKHIVTNTFNEPRRISGPQLDEFLLRIFDWNPQWLDPKAYDQKSQKNLPIVPEGQIPHLSSYANYSDYYSIMADLMLLEMWAGIVKEANDREFMKARRNMQAVIGQNSITQTPIRSTNHTLTVFTADILCSKSQIDLRQHATPGELVMLELPIVVEKEIHFRPIFAYVKDSHKTVITPSSTPYNKYLQNTVPNPYAVVTLTCTTKSLPLNIKFNRVLRMKTRYYMRPHLRMVQAILHLPSNPLLHHIIQPDVKKECYELTKDTNFKNYKFVTGDALNERQMVAVLSITNAVLEKKPKICLVEGPPGTGKSRVIVNLITEIMYGQNRYANNDRRRILVCAPSNAAVDEITMRLLEIRAKFQRENSHDSFRLVRVGNAKMMHPRVKEVSLTNLVERAWAAKEPGDVSADNEINRLRLNILGLKASMENSREPIPEGDSLKFKKRLEDWTTQLALLQSSKQVRYHNSGKWASLENKLLSTADIITCTLSSCYTQPMELAFGNRSSKKISVCIVDEATQSTEPETLIPLMLGVIKLILVGDPQQLPATVLSSRAKELNYDKSLFSRIHDKFMSELENPIISLNTQYRMAHPIVYWPNRFFYSHQLHSSIKSIVWPYSPYKIFNLTSVQDNNQFSNSDEATYVVNMIHAIVIGANLDNVEGIIRIGVITPYQDQRKIIQRKMEEKFATVPDRIKNRFTRQVSTVDGFQGQEREIIIMSCVRSNGIGFLTDRQRLCVALTRAKYSLFLCGNFKTFERDDTWGALIKDARSRNFYINTDHRTDQERIKQNIIKLAFMK
ncbi:putative helicase senataxin isoform X2 [Cotesia typhae]|uniref:putative helicase senataxin isoform X2 n=1 Tax=Cotesia typhae TaxID=2053667 RepID=UPI003D68A482